MKGYVPGAYERAVTAASRAYRNGTFNIQEFRDVLAGLRKAFNRVPAAWTA